MSTARERISRSYLDEETKRHMLANADEMVPGIALSHTVELTGEQIAAIPTTPIELVPAVPGKIIVPFQVVSHTGLWLTREIGTQAKPPKKLFLVWGALQPQYWCVGKVVLFAPDSVILLPNAKDPLPEFWEHAQLDGRGFYAFDTGGGPQDHFEGAVVTTYYVTI